MNFVADIPRDAGKVVGLTIFNDRLVVACEHGVYALVEEGEFRNEAWTITKRVLKPVALPP